MPASKIVYWEMFSKEYGWTPTQIIQQPANIIKAYIEIINMKRQMELASIKKDGRK